MGGEESRKHVTVCAAKGAAESRESEVQRARRLGCRGNGGRQQGKLPRRGQNSGESPLCQAGGPFLQRQREQSDGLRLRGGDAESCLATGRR